MNPEDIDMMNQLQQENEDLRNQLSMIDFPDNSEKLVSEKNFDTLAGIAEIPPQYKDVFACILATSTQWMMVESRAEEDDLVEAAEHTFETYKFEHPDCGLNSFDKMSIMTHYRRLLNRGRCGFERNSINTTIQQINYQTTPVSPSSGTPAKKEGLLAKLNPFRK